MMMTSRGSMWIVSGWRASQIRISGLFDALTFAQHGYVFGQKPPVEGVRVVEINVLPFFYGYMAAVFVVGVLR